MKNSLVSFYQGIIYMIFLQEILKKKNPIMDRYHPNGACIPGIGRMLIDVNGNIYPCEKTIESEVTCIGNIEEGFDLKKIILIQNIAKITEKDCTHCWALRFCKSCICHCADSEKNEISYELKHSHCESEKRRIEFELLQLLKAERL